MFMLIWVKVEIKEKPVYIIVEYNKHCTFRLLYTTCCMSVHITHTRMAESNALCPKYFHARKVLQCSLWCAWQFERAIVQHRHTNRGLYVHR